MLQELKFFALGHGTWLQLRCCGSCKTNGHTQVMSESDSLPMDAGLFYFDTPHLRFMLNVELSPLSASGAVYHAAVVANTAKNGSESLLLINPYSTLNPCHSVTCNIIGPYRGLVRDRTHCVSSFYFPPSCRLSSPASPFLHVPQCQTREPIIKLGWTCPWVDCTARQTIIPPRTSRTSFAPLFPPPPSLPSPPPVTR